MMSRETDLIEEHHVLVSRQFAGELDAAGAARMQAIETELDDIEEASPEAQYAQRQMDAIGTAINQLEVTILEALRDKPVSPVKGLDASSA